MAQQEIVIKSNKPFDPVATITRHWLKIAVFGGCLFILLSPFAFLFNNQFYKVSSKLVVLPESESVISRTDERSVAGYYNQFINTQLDLIKSPRILEKAITILPPETQKYFVTDGISLSFAARLLGGDLTVEQPHGTHFIDITLSKDDDRGMVDIVNTIMKVYMDEYQNDEEGKDYRRLSFLQTEKNNLNTEIEKKTIELKKISGEIASSVFAGNNDDASQFQVSYENAYRDRVEKEKKLEAITQEADTLKKLSLDAHIEEIVVQNSVVSKLDILAQESLYKLRDSQVGLSDDNPGKHQVEERIKDIKKYTEEQKDIIKEDTKRFLYEKRETELKEKIIHAETELNAAKMIEDEILKERDQLLKKRAEITTKELTCKQIETSLEQMKNQLNKVDTRIYELKLESKAPGKIRLERMADSQSMISGSNLKKLIMFIFLFAFGVITSGCVLFDMLDDRIRNEKDILNCLGTLPHRPIDDYLQVGMKGTPFVRVLLDDPTNKVAQSIHSLAIKFNKERQGHGAKIAVFTGVDAKSGVTEILLNTAYAMSKLCSKILVIETNFANPSLKKLVNIDKDKKGLLDFIKGHVSSSDCISHEKERGIDILLAGHLPSDDELVNLDRSKISKLIEEVKERYDFILIDTMPMLISDLAEFLIVQGDIVPLIIQADRSYYKLAYMAGQTLFKLEVPAIATVLNIGAPRYNTKFQETIIKLLLPFQELVRNAFVKTIHPEQEEPYPLFRMSWQSVNSMGTSFKLSLKRISKILNHRVIINACKSIFVLFLFVQVTLLITYISSTANVDTTTTNSVRGKISKPIKINQQPKVENKPVMISDDNNNTKFTNIKKAPISIHTKESLIPAKEEILRLESPNNESYIVNNIKNEQWISEQDNSFYTIQLMGSSNMDEVNYFINLHNLNGDIAVYHKKHNGKDWFSIIYGIYPSYQAAKDISSKLPYAILNSSPWVRSIKTIQQQIINTREKG
jgi:polysaccharide biosynthesis transport protein